MMMKSSNFQKIKGLIKDNREYIQRNNIIKDLEDKGSKLKIMNIKEAKIRGLLLFMKIDYYYIRLLVKKQYYMQSFNQVYNRTFKFEYYNNIYMNQKQRNTKPLCLSKSLSKTKFLKKQKSIFNYQQSFNDHKRSKSLYLKDKNFYLKNINNKSCFISKNWNRQSIQSGKNYSYLSQTPKISPDKINQTNLVNRFRAIQQVSPLMSINPLKQKILIEEVKRSMQYKSMQVSKLLGDLHHFFLSIQEVKWILQASYQLMMQYNQKISTFYQQYFKVYNRKDQIQSLVREAQQLITRFNQLGSVDINKNKIYFPITNKQEYSNSQYTTIQNLQKNKKSERRLENETNSKTGNPSLQSSIENKQNIYKFIQNLKKQRTNCQDPFTMDFKTKSFNATELNSPFKNKTLSQLIKLSQMRKTSQSKKNCQNQDEKENINFLNYLQKQKSNFEEQTFHKNKKISINNLTKLEELKSQKTNPFQGISISSNQNKNIKDQRIKELEITNQRLQIQILQLRRTLDDQNYNVQTLKTLQQQKEQLDCQKKLLFEQNEQIKNKYVNYEVYTKRIVQKTISLLTKISEQNQKSQDQGINIWLRQNQLDSNRSSTYRMSKYYYKQIFKMLQNITKLNQCVSNIDIGGFLNNQQGMKDKKYQIQRELIQMQYQISELRSVKEELNNYIQQNKKTLIQNQTHQKDFSCIYQNSLRMLYLQAKTMEQMFDQVQI